MIITRSSDLSFFCHSFSFFNFSSTPPIGAYLLRSPTALFWGQQKRRTPSFARVYSGNIPIDFSQGKHDTFYEQVLPRETARQQTQRCLQSSGVETNKKIVFNQAPVSPARRESHELWFHVQRKMNIFYVKHATVVFNLRVYRSDVNQGKWFYVCKLILFVNFITFTCVSLFFLWFL